MNIHRYWSYQLLIRRDKKGLPNVHQFNSNVERDRYKIVEEKKENETAKGREGRLETRSIERWLDAILDSGI